MIDRLVRTRVSLSVERFGNTEYDDVQRHFSFLRELIQKVLIKLPADGKIADLTIEGRLASILASMQAFQEYSAGLRDRHRNEYARRVRAGEFRDSNEKLEFLAHFRRVITEAEADWKVLPV